MGERRKRSTGLALHERRKRSTRLEPLAPPDAQPPPLPRTEEEGRAGTGAGYVCVRNWLHHTCDGWLPTVINQAAPCGVPRGAAMMDAGSTAAVLTFRRIDIARDDDDLTDLDIDRLLA